jgi:hypothetical protein
MVPLFTWLHLSDIHAGHGNVEHQWDQTLVMDSLRRDLLSLRGRNLNPEAIIVTGDVAFSGGGRSRPGQTENKEYTEAKRWLGQLASEFDISPTRILCVPGNHDVDRSVDNEPAVAALIARLRDGTELLDDALADATRRELLTRRQRNYFSFMRSLSGASENEASLFWRRDISLRGCIKLRFVGLNTALLAAANDDLGKLALGKEQLAATLNDIQNNEIVMTLMHHPLSGGWLRDERTVAAWIRSRAHIHLSGHIHDSDTESSRSGIGVKHVRISAGAAHNEAVPGSVPSGHGYSLGQIGVNDGGGLYLRVWPRLWNDRSMSFVVDGRNVLAGVDYTEHVLELGPKMAEGEPNSRMMLVAEGGPLKGRRLKLWSGVNFLGRNASADHFQVPDEETDVSRLHASVLVLAQHLLLQDESSNGTWLDGEKLPYRQPVVLRRGALIKVGQSLFRVARYRNKEALIKEKDITTPARCERMDAQGVRKDHEHVYDRELAKKP